MTNEELRECAKNELLSMGVPIHYLSWNMAREWMYDGRISQDSFDLYDDYWNTSEWRLSVQDYEVKASWNNLTKRYQ